MPLQARYLTFALRAGARPRPALKKLAAICDGETCVVGPVTGTQGEGFLLGLCLSRPASGVQEALLKRNILTGTSADPRVLRLLPPFTLAATEVDLLRDALVDLAA